MTSTPIRIGTRGSPLALAQTEETRQRLVAAHPHLGADDAVETVVIRTTGDKVLDRPLAEVGGKGMFTKEIDEAMLDGRIDLAVHSMKDLPTWLPDGIVLACVLPREDPRDGFIARAGGGLDGLPTGAVVGTSSLRRQAQLLHRRPDLRVVTLRGNVQTRLAKVGEGVVDATLLALAGLRRLGLADAVTAMLEPEDMLPAVGQGAIGITCRTEDDGARTTLAPLNDVETSARIATERAMLTVLDGSCRTPIGGLAEISGNELRLRGLVVRPDGSEIFETARVGSLHDAEALGRDAGEELRIRAGPGFFDGPA